jgi:kumamolisin
VLDRWPADRLTREELERLVQPDKAERQAVVRAFRDAGIDHAHTVGMRAVHVQARWGQLKQLISIDQCRYRGRDGVVVGRRGRIVLDDPALSPVVAVFGLDNRRTLSPYVIKSHVIKSHVIKSHVIKSHVAGSPERAAVMALASDGPARAWWSPREVADRYAFPEAVGAGCRVGLLAFSGQLGGTGQMVAGGYRREVLETYFAEEAATGAAPRIADAVVRGPGNWPADGSTGSEFTDELMLDLSVLGALAPGADVTVYFSEPTEQGFVDALHHVAELDDPPDVLLVCYGSPEDSGTGATWTTAAVEQGEEALAAAALRGITVVCSCGDNGAAGAPLSTRVQADFPASSAWVLSCGGTRADRTGEPETVWNDGTGASGGGLSALVDRPRWQAAVPMPPPVDAWRRETAWQGRGVPDVAAVADPATGVAVVDAQGDTVAAGGTSVSAPVWAALVARCVQLAGRRLGFVNPAVYALADGLVDVSQGDNGAYAAVPGGWDPCTGLGVPDGRALWAALRDQLSPEESEAQEPAPGRG